MPGPPPISDAQVGVVGSGSVIVLPDTSNGEHGWLHFLLEVAESISSADGLDRALNRLAWLALKATGADRSAILVPDEQDPVQVKPAAGASQTGDLAVLWDRFRRMDPINLKTDLRRPAIWRSTHATVIEDVASSDLVPDEWKRAWESKSIAYAPLRAAGEMFGILAVDYATAPHVFAAEEIKLLEAIAAAAGVALRSAALVEQLQHSVRVERRLSECNAALLAGLSRDVVLDEIAERFASLLPDTACGINLLGADGSMFRLVAWRGIAPQQDEVRISDLPAEDVNQIREAWIQDPRQVIIVSDIGSKDEWGSFIPEGIGTGMLVPLVEGKETLGFVAVGRKAVPFNEDEIRVASAFADHAALALIQARLTDALQLRLRLAEALSLLDEAVLRSSDLRSVFRALNRNIGRGIGVECLRLAFADKALAEVLRAPSAQADEIEHIRRWRRSPSAGEVRDGDRLAIPVRVHGRIAGILWLRVDPIDSVRLELIRAIAGAFGEVAYKAKLQRKAERSAQELAVAADRERIARDLHDTVGQTLYGIGLNLQDLLYDVSDPSLREKLGALRVLASQGVADVRSAVYALSFVHVREQGLVPSIQSLVHEFTKTTEVEAQCKVFGQFPTLGEEAQSVLYRVVHEALVNVERHARATGVVISIGVSGEMVELSIRDDGIGLGQREVHDWRASARFGMRMMAKSVEELGGRFEARKAIPRGFIITAMVPVAIQGRLRGVGG